MKFRLNSVSIVILQFKLLKVFGSSFWIQSGLSLNYVTFHGTNQNSFYVLIGSSQYNYTRNYIGWTQIVAHHRNFFQFSRWKGQAGLQCQVLSIYLHSILLKKIPLQSWHYTEPSFFNFSMQAV